RIEPLELRMPAQRGPSRQPQEDDLRRVLADEAEGARFVDQADVALGKLALATVLAHAGRTVGLHHQRDVRRIGARRWPVGNLDRGGLDRDQLPGRERDAADCALLQHFAGQLERQPRKGPRRRARPYDRALRLVDRAQVDQRRQPAAGPPSNFGKRICQFGQRPAPRGAVCKPIPRPVRKETGARRNGQGESWGIMTYRGTRAASVLARASIVALAAGTALAAVPAAAQQEPAAQPQGDDAIIVTAQLREQNVQDVPLSISAVSGEPLEQRSQTTLTDITAQMPSLLLQRNPAGQGNSVRVFIRGVGQSDQSPSVEPGVGTYIDDIYYGTVLGSAFDLTDIERIEVLRGPQGTLS